jgi:hypothetical protein
MPDDPAATAPRIDATAAIAERYALTIVLPLWMTAASVDYVLHRRSHIEATSGTFEARLHVGGIALSAVPVLAALALEIDAGVIALAGLGLLVHAGMTIWDIGYADGRRRIVPFEQHVHALLELLPFTALSLVAIAHERQTRALFGRGPERPRFALRRKQRPIPVRALAATIVAFALAVALPYGEELARCMRYERAQRDAG